ncbi:MAG: DUF1839 family protein [Burkholderiales bacterium]|nr:DUF1839 family protein [Burkholderiales bacterium]
MAALTVPALAHLLAVPPVLQGLHDPQRPWPQTNCAVDLLIELVAAYGHDPVWMMAFTLIQDFEGDHFSFFKVPSDDLEALYGLSVHELAVWDHLVGHVAEQVARGRVVLVEVDGFYLPDTRGVTYHEQHGKTTIGVFAMDVAARWLAYFHNETRGELTGDDFDGVMQLQPSQSSLLMPYTEVVKAAGRPHADPAACALAQLQRHWQRRPAANPFLAYADALPAHLETLASREPAYFHAYAFNTMRQFGANFGLLEALLLRWPDTGFQAAATCAATLANEAKVLQFKLARAASRRKFDGLTDAVRALAHTHDELMAHLASSPLMCLRTGGDTASP